MATRRLNLCLSLGCLLSACPRGWAGETCATATPISCNTLIVGSTAGSTIDGTSLCNPGSINAPDVWYRIRVESSGLLTASLCTPQTNYDSVISLHTACGSTSIACGDDECGLRSELTEPVMGGRDYYIRISGFQGATGSFGLIVSGPACSCADCNTNSICDVNESLSDCDSNGTPDLCESHLDCNSNNVPDVCEGGDCNGNGTPDSCEAQSDCNTNGTYDICETMIDCNSNGIFDPCEQAHDCNSNGIPDDCDLLTGAGHDADTDGILDECEGDCNTNGTPDHGEGLPNCNNNNLPDICEIAAGGLFDCNTNGIPDPCESLMVADCNSNGYPDLCEITSGAASDVNSNLVPDACETDCDADGTPDVSQAPADCNTSGTADVCEIAAGASTDCNSNGVPDECESVLDCDTNGVPDECQVRAGTAVDIDADGVLDVCGPALCFAVGDCNASGGVDGEDVQSFVDCLLGSGGGNCYCADVNTNGAVDASDVAGFVDGATQSGGCTADIAIDSNNDGRVTDDRAADAAVEDSGAGKVIVVNDDDDNTNGIPDMDEPGSTEGEDDLVPAILSARGDATGLRWRVVYDTSRLRVYSGRTRGGPISSGALQAFPLPDVVYVEGRAPASGATLQLDFVDQGGGIVSSDSANVSTAASGLNADLNFDGTIDAADSALRRSRGAYVIVNNDDDDNNSTVDTEDSAVTAGATPPSRDEDNLTRVTITGMSPAEFGASGTVTLTRSSGALRVFSSPLKGVAARLLYSSSPASFSATVPGNGRRSWNLANSAERAAFQQLVANGVYVEGLAPSTAQRADRLTLTYAPAGGTAARECGRLDITVVQFLGIEARVRKTPPLHAQLGNDMHPLWRNDHSYSNIRGKVVRHLDEVVFPADPNDANDGGTHRFMFRKPYALALPRRCEDQLALSVQSKPALPAGWKIFRAPDDPASLGAGVPALTPAGDTATMNTDECGSFLVCSYVDADGNGDYTPGEPRTILPLVLVQPVNVVSASVASAGRFQIQRFGTPGQWDEPNRGGMQVTTGLFDLDHPDRSAIHLDTTIDMIGGGPVGRRGLDRTFGGWCQNLAGFNYVGTYMNQPTPFLITYIFAMNLPPALPGDAQRRAFLPGGPPPTPQRLALPLLDTGRRVPGLGSDSSIMAHSKSQAVSDLTVGRRIQFESVDSPGDYFYGDHPGHPGHRLTNVAYSLTFDSYLVIWCAAEGAPPSVSVSDIRNDAARRCYVVADKVNWSLMGNWSINADGEPTANVTPTITRTLLTPSNPPISARNVVETHFPSVLTRYSYDMR